MLFISSFLPLAQALFSLHFFCLLICFSPYIIVLLFSSQGFKSWIILSLSLSLSLITFHFFFLNSPFASFHLFFFFFIFLLSSSHKPILKSVPQLWHIFIPLQYTQVRNHNSRFPMLTQGIESQQL